MTHKNVNLIKPNRAILRNLLFDISEDGVVSEVNWTVRKCWAPPPITLPTDLIGRLVVSREVPGVESGTPRMWSESSTTEPHPRYILYFVFFFKYISFNDLYEIISHWRNYSLIACLKKTKFIVKIKMT